MVRLVASGDCARMRVDRFLADRCPGTSRAAVQRWLELGLVRLDGQVCKAKAKVHAGTVVEFEPLSPPPSQAEADPSIAVDVVFEDEWLIVVDKPAGLVVHPGRGHWDKTLVNGLLALPDFSAPTDPSEPEGALRPGIVHRIDRDTSGLLVVAKTAAAREGLKEQFAAHSLKRSYLALTRGVPASGLIDTFHARHPTQRIKFTSRAPEGKRAVTHVELLESFGAAALVRCRLQTGRTHQIRIHLAEQRGTPILADAVYGPPPRPGRLGELATELGRQALHATELGFEHPVLGGERYFQSPLPQDMARALEVLRGWPELAARRY